LNGQYNLCEKVRFLGAPPYPGTFQEYICHKELFTHKLADGIDLKTGALIEPLAVGYNAVSMLSLKPSQRLLISGAGPIGLSAMLIARAAGARVTVTDIDDYHLDFARSAGADEVINVRRSVPEPGRYDCAVEASGNVQAFETLLSGVRKGSRLVLVGMTSAPLCLNVNAVLKKSLNILAVYRYANHFQPVMELLAGGRIDTRGIITHEYEIDDILEAFKFAENPAEKKIKVVINFK
jgi:L-iditol 2-dehydrogenase